MSASTSGTSQRLAVLYRAALVPLGLEELANPHGGESFGVEGLDDFGIYGDSEDRHHAQGVRGTHAGGAQP